MLRVGLSGGIGSGKSTVSARLAELGAVVIDSDSIAREVVASGTPGLAEIVDVFGEGILGADGSLDRPALGTLVFADTAARRDLESITHPRIAAHTAELFDHAPSDAIVVHDVPLLVEKEMGAAYHLVVIVSADEQQRLRRLLDNRGMDPDAARSRIASQANDTSRWAAADVWLPNEGTVTDLQRRVDRLWAQRLVPFEHNVRHRVPSRRPEALQIHPPDLEWPAQAWRLAGRLRAVLGETALAVEHIGSTAIAGMPSKDVIDIQVVVADLADLDSPHLRMALADAGFPRAAGDWWDESHDPGGGVERTPKRMLLSTDPQRIAHIAVRTEGSGARCAAILFRDWMRADAEAQVDYARLKQRLLARGLSTSEYAEAKRPWFADAFARAQQWAERTGWSEP